MTDDQRQLEGDIASDAHVAITFATGLIETLITGAPIMTALGEIGRRVGELRSRSERETLIAMVEILKTRAGQIDSDFVASEEFVSATAEIFDRVVRSREMDKRNFYAALWSSMATRERPDQGNFERLVDTLERLRLSHLWLLHRLSGPYDADWPVASRDQSREDFLEQFAGSLDRGILELDFADLEREGLIERQNSPGSSGYRDLRYRLTDHGKRFHQFVILPYEDVHPPE